ncbi:P22AR C-terminal domain-containing protein, partial [Escherichia coli]|uniref:P22AR C-terminal domain-containing protein n=1 Tax=Escherichia coli TaxID=562 RepID=UPI0024B5A1F0
RWWRYKWITFHPSLTYSGRCYDYGHEFSCVIGMARDVLINHTRDVDINEPDGPTNLSAWIRLKNKELPPSVHNY